MSNPGPNKTVTSNLTQDNVSQSDGHQIGSAATALIGFYGATAVSQPTAAAQATITDASGGSAAATNGILTLTGTYNSTILANAIATLAAQTNAIQAALVTLGLIKGS
jgi:hypothetical protein